MNEGSNKLTEAITQAPETDAHLVAHNQSATPANFDTGVLVDREQGGLSEASLHNELTRLLEANTRRVNIQAVLPMAAAWSKDTNRQLAALESRNAKLTDDLTNAREEITELKTANKERDKHVFIVYAGLMFGPIMVQFGLEQLSLNSYKIGGVALIFGVFMIVGAFLTQRGDKK